MKHDKSHGGAYDRGASDAYYWHARNPHKWSDRTGLTRVTDLTPDEVEAYHAGYDGCSDRKDWGHDD